MKKWMVTALAAALLGPVCPIHAQSSAHAQAAAGAQAAVVHDDYAWMADVSGKHAHDLYADPRFKKVVWSGFPHDDVHWMSGSHGRSLPAGVYYFALGGFLTYPGDDIRRTDAGGIAVDGYLQGSADASKWLFWSNAAPRRGDMIFAFISKSQDAGKERTGDLDIYTSRKDNLQALPADFMAVFKAWETKIGISGFNKATVHGAGVNQPITGF